MILYRVVSSTRNVLGDLGPPVSVDFAGFHENEFLVVVPARFSDGRVKLVMPPFSALFPVPVTAFDALLELRGYVVPFLEPILLNEHDDEHVFLDQPLYLVGLQHEVLVVLLGSGDRRGSLIQILSICICRRIRFLRNLNLMHFGWVLVP